jgi:hypothetical protein
MSVFQGYLKSSLDGVHWEKGEIDGDASNATGNGRN